MRRSGLHAAFIVFAALICPARVFGAVVDLAGRSDAVYVSRTTEMLVDRAGDMTIEQVAAANDFAVFKRLPNTRSVYWLRLRFIAPPGNEAWYLFMGYKAETADLYLPDDAGGYRVLRSGVSLAQSLRPVSLLGSIAFQLPSSTATQVAYVRMTASDTNPTIAYSPATVLWTINEFNLLMIVGLDSILLAMLVSSLVLFAMARSRLYAVYAAYLLAELISRSNETGLASAVLWPNWSIAVLRADVVLDALRIVMATIVVRTFLRLRQHSLLLDRMNFAIAIAAFGYALAMVLGAPLHHSWSREAAFIYVPLWIISAVVAWRHGEDRAPLFVIAWSALLLFSLSFALQQLFGIGRGNLIAELFISRGMYFGVGIQSVLLSLAFSTDLRHVARSRDQYARLATVDGLTGIANRRRFDTVLQDEWQRAQRGLRPLSLLMIDVDYFKAFNDRYGHAAGDTCLRHIAQTGEAGLQRNGGLFSRYGGEEFGVILPNTDATEASRVAEAFRQAIADQSTPHEDSPHGRITVSIGIATTCHEAPLNPDELQAHADRALYAAKQQGRNSVSVAALQRIRSLPLK